MILEYLQPDASILDGITVIIRALYYIATIGAAGLAIFAIGFEHRLEAHEAARLRRTLLGAILAGLALSLLALILRVLVLTAGANISDPNVWAAVMRSRIGDAFWLRTAGLVLLAAMVTNWRIRSAMTAIGALLMLASYAAMGHSMLFAPRQEIAALVVLHLAVVAFWVGSLLPLLWISQRRDGASAARLIQAWSGAASFAVMIMIASGVLLTWYLTLRLDRLWEAWHGWALAWKGWAVSAGRWFSIWQRGYHHPCPAPRAVGRWQRPPP